MLHPIIGRSRPRGRFISVTRDSRNAEVTSRRIVADTAVTDLRRGVRLVHARVEAQAVALADLGARVAALEARHFTLVRHGKDSKDSYAFGHQCQDLLTPVILALPLRRRADWPGRVSDGAATVQRCEAITMVDRTDAGNWVSPSLVQTVSFLPSTTRRSSRQQYRTSSPERSSRRYQRRAGETARIPPATAALLTRQPLPTAIGS